LHNLELDLTMALLNIEIDFLYCVKCVQEHFYKEMKKLDKLWTCLTSKNTRDSEFKYLNNND